VEVPRDSDVVALMYESFYGLRERPFDVTPDPRFLLMTTGHREALTTIQYGITGRKGITLLVGGSGTGKTTLVQVALAGLEQQKTKALFLTNPTLTRSEFFEFLAHGFGLSNAAAKSKTHFLRELEAVLRKRHASGAATALIVDEAQAMPDELLEEVRLLANTETATDKLLSVVLVGQPELADRINERSLQQLKQRVALRSRLPALTPQESAAFIAERLRIAGGDLRHTFDPDAVAAVCACAAGIPRTISVVCDNALVSGFALDQKPVGRAIIIEVCRDFDLPIPKSTPAAAPAALAPAVARPVPAPKAAPEPAGSLMLVRPMKGGSLLRTKLGMITAEEERPQPPAPAAAPAAPRWGFRALFMRTPR
jgi:general secretion pathway protein A